MSKVSLKMAPVKNFGISQELIWAPKGQELDLKKSLLFLSSSSKNQTCESKTW